MKDIYLDNNATTKTDEAVFEEMMPYFCENYGNPSSMHFFGGKVAPKLEEARERVANLIGADASEILFTSGGTESDNSAILAALKMHPTKKTIITTRVEHPAVLNLCRQLGRSGYNVVEIGVDSEGRLNIDELEKALTNDVAVVSIMFANNETGVVFPINKIGQMVKAKGITFHVDAVQAIGKIDIDTNILPVDMLSISGHKVHAPKGVGALYVRRGVSFRSFVVGGHQERGRRGGTENIPGIIGIGKAAELAKKYIEIENSHVRKLRDKLENAVLNNITETKLNGHKTERLPNTSNISFNYIEGEAILLSISKLGIHASSGSACTSGSLQPSHVLRAMGVPFTSAHGSIRFSLSRFTTETEVDFVIQNLPDVIAQLRAISPFWPYKTAERV